MEQYLYLYLSVSSFYIGACVGSFLNVFIEILGR